MRFKLYPTFRSAIRPFIRKGVWYWILFVLALAGGCYLGHLLSENRSLTDLHYWVYRHQLQIIGVPAYPKRTVLVMLDDNDYWGDASGDLFQARTPIKRDKLAEIINRLNDAGANTIALDVDLRSPQPDHPKHEFSDYAREDAELFAAINHMCARQRHVILAASIKLGANGYEIMPSVYDGQWNLKESKCVSRGYIQLPYDMRRMPGALEVAEDEKLDSLSLAMVRIADPNAYELVKDGSEGEGFRFSQYLTAGSFIGARANQTFVFNAGTILRTDVAALHEKLADKLVIVGAHWHSNAKDTGPIVDIHNSPGGPEPGVMLHANFVEAMLDRTGTFAPISDATAEVVEIVLAVVLGLIGALEIHAAWKWSSLGLGCAVSFLLTYVLLQNVGLFLDFLIPVLMSVAHSVVWEIAMMWQEIRHLEHRLANSVHVKQGEAIP